MYLDAVAHLRVLVLGDAIRDRYVFVRPLGKSVKESVLSVGYEREEEYKGGVWAAAAHIEALCAQVDVMHGHIGIENLRYIEGPGNRKLFTVHQAVQETPTPARDFRAYDLVIVADFGHGTMTPELIAQVTREAKYLAVNTQTNSSNFGFNLITKYPRADLVVIDELEARLAVHDRSGDIKDVITALAASMNVGKIVVTLGGRGAIGWHDGEGYREAAGASQVIDTMGAGDAFLTVASVFACVGFPIRELVSIGNAAGAAKVGIVGHRTAVSRQDLANHEVHEGTKKPITQR